MHSAYWLLFLLIPFVIAAFGGPSDDIEEFDVEESPVRVRVTRRQRHPLPRNPGGNSHQRRIRRRASLRALWLSQPDVAAASAIARKAR